MATTLDASTVTALKKQITDYLDAHGLEVTNVEEYECHDENSAENGIYLHCVVSEGGCEGDGEHVERTFAVHEEATKNVICYFTVYGYYASYAGTDWESAELILVEPREVMVTVYQSVEPT